MTHHDGLTQAQIAAIHAVGREIAADYLKHADLASELDPNAFDFHGDEEWQAVRAAANAAGVDWDLGDSQPAAEVCSEVWAAAKAGFLERWEEGAASPEPATPAYPDEITWHTPRECQGQIVTDMYGIDEDGQRWERTFDASDRTTTYRRLDDDGPWEPWNGRPPCALDKDDPVRVRWAE